MNRGEIITRFRQENPEVTQNVASDATLESWAEVGNLEIARKARLIKGDTTFSAVVGISEYNLTNEIDKFYDIDELPGGGVAYNNKRLTMESVASLDMKRPSWRTASNGTPKDYFRRNQFLVLGTPPDATSDIQVYCILLADPLDDDDKTPFNQLEHLEAYHYSLVLYLKMRVFMGKVKKPDIAQLAQQEYNEYVDNMTKETNRGIFQAIRIRPPSGYMGTGRRR